MSHEVLPSANHKYIKLKIALPEFLDVMLDQTPIERRIMQGLGGKAFDASVTTGSAMPP